jgi:hypothetical protein
MCHQPKSISKYQELILKISYLFTNLKAAQIQPLEDFAGHMPTLGLS